MTVTGSQLRTLLELRSTWFTPALLSLAPAAKTITYGGAVSLTGFARGVDGVSLEAKTAGQDWTPVGDLLLDGEGAFATVLKPQVATQYRLVSGTVRAGLAKIAVAPRVDAQVTAAGARGTMRPALAGAPVQLQQQAGTAWSTLATGVTDASGRLQLRAGARDGHVPRSLRTGPRPRARPLGSDRGAVRRPLALAVAALALVLPASSLAFDNTEPLAAKQWYLEQDNAWSFWQTPPKLFPIRVAVIDSGIDGGHPDLVGRVVAAKSFVGGSPYRDTQGHGTFVAGEIAANPSNNEGIAGLAFNAQLVIAKVVQADGEISLEGEVAAIRWAVDQGARVINLSLGGVRDPLDAKLDTYSPLEQAAIEYAYSKGVVVVAAVGNGPQSPATPWRFAHYPAALPHVIGVSAIRRNGSVPDVLEPRRGLQRPDGSGRRDVLDGAAEPRREGRRLRRPSLLRLRPVRVPQRDRHVVRRAAGLRGGRAAARRSDPSLRPEQVSWLLERSASDASALTGCSMCPIGRDLYTGWGTLDVLAALTMLTDGTTLPVPDRLEPNDDAGPWAHALPPLPRTIDASLDYWDDNIDVYRVHLNAHAKLFARLTGQGSRQARALGARDAARRGPRRATRNRASPRAGRPARRCGSPYRAGQAGIYYLEVKLVSKTQDPVAYRLALARG